MGKKQKIVKKNFFEKVLTLLNCFALYEIGVCMKMVENIVLQFVILYFAPEMPLLVFVHSMNRPLRFVWMSLDTFQVPFEEVN